METIKSQTIYKSNYTQDTANKYLIIFWLDPTIDRFNYICKHSNSSLLKTFKIACYESYGFVYDQQGNLSLLAAEIHEKFLEIVDHPDQRCAHLFTWFFATGDTAYLSAYYNCMMNGGEYKPLLIEYWRDASELYNVEYSNALSSSADKKILDKLKLCGQLIGIDDPDF